MKLSVVVLSFAVTAMAQNWPGFRGTNASGVAGGLNLPLEWDATTGKNILWKTPVPGLAHASPVVWGDRVFIATAVSSDPNAVFRHGLYGDVEPSPDVSKHSWRVYALDRKTGKILWERSAHEGTPRTKRHPKSSQASSTPATDGKHVAVFFGSEGLYVYDYDGKLLWKKDLGVLNAGWFFDPDYEWGMASSPVIYKDLVIIQADIQRNSFLAAYRLKDGAQAWSVSRDEIPGWSTPVIHEGKARTELITNSVKAIRGHDPVSGKQLWQLTGNSEITVTVPVIHDDLIFVANGYPPIQPIYAIRPGAKGDITLKDNTETNEFIVWSKKRGGPYMPSPLALDSILYICSNNGILTTYRTKTGERIYQQRISPKGGAYSASPVAADGKLYFASEDGEVNVVTTGEKFQLVATNPMGEVLMATPALTPGMLVIRGRSHVFGIGEKATPKPAP